MALYTRNGPSLSTGDGSNENIETNDLSDLLRIINEV